MRITRTSIVVAIIAHCFGPQSSHAFVPQTTSAKRRSGAFVLQARYTPVPPPIPPPPPEKSPNVDFDRLLQKLTSLGDDVSADDFGAGNFVDGLMRDLSSQMENGIALPSLDKLWPDDDLPVSFAQQLPALDDLNRQFQALDRSVITMVEEMAQKVQDGVTKDYPNLGPYVNGLKSMLAPALASPSLTILVSALVTYTVVSALLSWDRGPPPSQPYPAQKYDPIAARAYFDNKLYLVLGRGLEILVQSLQFGLRVLQDKLRYVWSWTTRTKEEGEDKQSSLYANCVARFSHWLVRQR